MRGTLIAVAAVAILAGCSTYDSLTQRIAQSITPYRITVVQGNFVSKEAASQMQVGMSRAQVRQLLGTPLLVLSKLPTPFAGVYFTAAWVCLGLGLVGHWVAAYNYFWAILRKGKELKAHDGGGS